ncbi:hypothetical protein E2C01_023237 [Portunus trituberculatus]|uniref:Uncharacterized protein n=1 Tax=Portunus trituberculatus TaxID=210409 RepID=A0A5B7EAL8_PORTR|nr:hypothetical protein [Portunus trituberculatus]
MDDSPVTELWNKMLGCKKSTELFSKTLANNSTLDDSGFVPPCPPPSDYFMSSINRDDVFHAFSGLNPQKAYGPDGVLAIVLKTCASVLALCLAKLFQLCLLTTLHLSTSCQEVNRSRRDAT